MLFEQQLSENQGGVFSAPSNKIRSASQIAVSVFFALSIKFKVSSRLIPGIKLIPDNEIIFFGSRFFFVRCWIVGGFSKDQPTPGFFRVFSISWLFSSSRVAGPKISLAREASSNKATRGGTRSHGENVFKGQLRSSQIDAKTTPQSENRQDRQKGSRQDGEHERGHPCRVAEEVNRNHHDHLTEHTPSQHRRGIHRKRLERPLRPCRK
jgi:hypothetical protein